MMILCYYFGSGGFLILDRSPPILKSFLHFPSLWIVVDPSAGWIQITRVYY